MTLLQPSVLIDLLSFPAQREERAGLPPDHLKLKAKILIERCWKPVQLALLHPRSDLVGQLVCKEGERTKVSAKMVSKLRHVIQKNNDNAEAEEETFA